MARLRRDPPLAGRRAGNPAREFPGSPGKLYSGRSLVRIQLRPPVCWRCRYDEYYFLHRQYKESS